LFLVFTGLRRSEAGDLRWAHVHLDAQSPYVELPASLTKSGKAESVPLVPEVVGALRAHRRKAKDRDAVFAAIPSMEEFRADLARAKIEEVDARGRRVVLHSLRHSLATMLAVSSVPMAVAQKIMRHRDIRLTAEVYTDEGLLPLSSAMAALPSLIRD
jgi:integrase